MVIHEEKSKEKEGGIMKKLARFYGENKKEIVMALYAMNLNANSYQEYGLTNKREDEAL